MTRGAFVTYAIILIVTLGIWLDPIIRWARRA
jgi:hypothetical protein